MLGFLIRPSAAYMTGQTLVLDGGLSTITREIEIATGA
jgi:hypothetical protein